MPTELPTLKDLNPKQSDYAARLDAGVEQLEVALAGVTEEATAFYDRFDPVAYLRSKGFEVEELPPSVHEHRTGDDVTERLQRRLSIVTTKSREDEWRLEDEVQAYKDQTAAGVREIQEREKQIRRRFSEFSAAIHTLTQVKPLTMPNPDYQDLHFYIVRPDGVYEAHAGENGIIPPTKSDTLDPALFQDQKFIAEFRERSKGVGANAYLITNPSQKIPVNALLVTGGCLAVEQLEERERFFDKEKTPAQRLADRLKDIVRTSK